MNEEQKPLPPHEFNAEKYCQHCGIGEAFQQQPGEPCPALCTPAEIAEAAWLEAETVQPYRDEMAKPVTEVSVEPGKTFIDESLTIPSGWESVKIREPSPQVWLAVQTEYGSPDQKQTEPSAMQIIGVFSGEALAIAACRSPTDCIGPLVLNSIFPREPVAWPGAYYPLAIPPFVIGDLSSLFAFPVGHVTIGEHGEAYWHQAAVPPEENGIPGVCSECGSGPVEGQVGVYVLPRGWPYSAPCRTCERRIRQLCFNVGYDHARRAEEAQTIASEPPAAPPESASSAEPPAAEEENQFGSGVKLEDIDVTSLPVGVFVQENGKPGLILGPSNDSIVVDNQIGDAAD